MKRNSCGFVLADKVCPICFVKDNRHAEGCRRGMSADEITAIVMKLPDLVPDRPSRLERPLK